MLPLVLQGEGSPVHLAARIAMGKPAWEPDSPALPCPHCCINSRSELRVDWQLQVLSWPLVLTAQQSVLPTGLPRDRAGALSLLH